MEDFLIAVVKSSDGWVIVIVFVLYIFWQVYKQINGDAASIKKLLEINAETTKTILLQFVTSINTLGSKIEKLIDNLNSKV